MQARWHNTGIDAANTAIPFAHAAVRPLDGRADVDHIKQARPRYLVTPEAGAGKVCHLEAGFTPLLLI